MLYPYTPKAMRSRVRVMHPAMVLVVAMLALSALVAAENHDACAVESANNPPQTCVAKLRQDEGPPADRRKFNYCGYMNKFLQCYPKSCCQTDSTSLSASRMQREIQEEKDKYKDKTVSLHCACWYAGRLKAAESRLSQRFMKHISYVRSCVTRACMSHTSTHTCIGRGQDVCGKMECGWGTYSECCPTAPLVSCGSDKCGPLSTGTIVCAGPVLAMAAAVIVIAAL